VGIVLKYDDVLVIKSETRWEFWKNDFLGSGSTNTIGLNIECSLLILVVTSRDASLVIYMIVNFVWMIEIASRLDGSACKIFNARFKFFLFIK
jgi:hypothetical protein